MSLTNSRIQKVKPSETLAVKARASELRAEGRSIIDLSAGEPDIDTPDHIKEAAIKALRDGHTKYTNVNGIPELRSAIANKFKSENGIECDSNSVIVSNGGKQVIYSFFDSVLEKGDEVIIPAPYWVSYPPIVELCGGTPKIVHANSENGLKITPAQLEANLNDKTKVVVINSPSNPTGVGYTGEELAELSKVIEKYPNCLVLSDEVYEKIVFNGFKFESFAKVAPQIANRVFTVNAFSKTYSMTGWRVGYACGPKEIIAAMGRHQSQTTSNVCSIAQYAALAALTGPHSFVTTMIDNYTRRVSLALDIVSKIPGVSLDYQPNGAFYLFLSIRQFIASGGHGKVRGSADFASYLLDEAGVAVVPGEAFGDDQAFRVSVSSSDANLSAGLERIKEVLSR